MENPRRRFAVELADKLGYASIDGMLAEMMPKDINERWALAVLRQREDQQRKLETCLPDY